MKRLNFNIDQSQYDWLSKRSEETGVSISELIRRAIAHWIDIKSRPIEQEMDKHSDDPNEVNFPERPFTVDVTERLEMIQQLLYFSLTDEQKAELDRRSDDLHGINRAESKDEDG